MHGVVPLDPNSRARSSISRPKVIEVDIPDRIIKICDDAVVDFFVPIVIVAEDVLDRKL